MCYQIIIINPVGGQFGRVFEELGELIYYSLTELEYETSIHTYEFDSDNTLDLITLLSSSECFNIILGWHQLPNCSAWVDLLPKSTILINTEQLGAHPLTPSIVECAKKCQLWDYSEKNIAYFANLGIVTVKYLRLGYQPQLNRISKADTQDIDVLFYGSVNQGDRRDAILNSLVRKGLRCKRVFDVWGSERDNLISRSKVVLNMHYYDAYIFEAVRVFYLLTNSIPVVAEVNPNTSIDPIIRNGVYAASYEKLALACARLVLMDEKRENLISSAALFKNYRQVNFIKNIL